MKTPYFVTNKNEYEKILKPLLLEWGYEEDLNKNSSYNIIVLDDCDKLGIICNYTDVGQIDSSNRYLESNIYRFLEKAANLMGKEYRPFLGIKDVIWCPAEELANQVLKIAKILGYQWVTGESFENNKWRTYGGETCYYIYDGRFANRTFYGNRNFNIISAKEFIDYYKNYLNMEEKRNISISLEEAREWYNSNNKVLAELALKAYTREELELDFNTVIANVRVTTPALYIVPDCEDRKWCALHKLAIIANYFNARTPKPSTQYFIKVCTTEKSKFQHIVEYDILELYILTDKRIWRRLSSWLVIILNIYSNEKVSYFNAVYTLNECSSFLSNNYFSRRL